MTPKAHEELRAFLVAQFSILGMNEGMNRILQTACSSFFQGQYFPTLRLLRDMRDGKVPHIRYLSRHCRGWYAPTKILQNPEKEAIERLMRNIQAEVSH